MKATCIKKAGILGSILIAAVLSIAATSFKKETTPVVAPQIEGKILINGKHMQEVELKAGNVVSLFKDFKTGKHKITFTFDGADLALDEQKRGVVLFEYTTTLYEGKKKLGSVTRKPMPYFPGEMLDPVETFDIVNLLTYAQGDPLKKKYPGHLEGSGNYRIVIAAKPVGAQGKIKSAELIVWI